MATAEESPSVIPGSMRAARVTPKQVLYASTNHAWSYGWTFYQMLATALAAEHDVVYVDTPLSLARAPLREWGQLRSPRVTTEAGVRVARTLGLPLQRTWAQRRATGAIAASAIGRWAAQAGFDPDVVWTYTPWETPLIERFPRARSVYWTADHAGLIEGEAEHIARVDVVLAASDPVYEELHALFGDKVRKEAVACDFPRYNAAREQPIAVAPLEGLRRPIFGYAGWISPRVDFALLRELSERTEGSVVVAGVTAGLSAAEVASACGSNVVVLGPQSPEELPRLMAAFDVALIPYTEDEFNLHSNPVKFYEYLASGRTTVTTDIPSLRRFGTVASVGPAATFVERALAAVHREEEIDARIEVAREHSFAALVDRLGEVIG